MSYLALFEELAGRWRSTQPLSTASMDNNVRRLRDVQNRSADDDLRDGPPQCRVRVVGDPEIIDGKGHVFHYYGPALLVNLDNRGMVRSLEFVGVKEDNDYISEVWHLDVRTRKYKYQDL